MTEIGEAFCFLGDSITEGVGATKTYIDFIHEATGIPVYRYGKNGAQTTGLFDQMDRMDAEVGTRFTTLFVFIGTNDFNAGVPIGDFWTVHSELFPCNSNADGEFTEFSTRAKREFIMDNATFCGRLNRVFERIKRQYYDKRVILMTPLHRAYAYFGGTNIQPNELYSNKSGHFLDEYIRAERQAADIWSVELIDLYRNSGLFPLFDGSAQAYFSNVNTDRLHPGNEGHRIIARTILNAL